LPRIVFRDVPLVPVSPAAAICPFKRSLRYKEIVLFENFWNREKNGRGAANNDKASVFSQAAPGWDTTSPYLRHQALRAFQLKGETGAVLTCCSTDCGRHVRRHSLPDPSASPDHWICSMATDSDELLPPLWNPLADYFAQAEYTAGSLVWARGPRFPWWPAIIDHCADIEAYFRVSDGTYPNCFYLENYSSQVKLSITFSTKTINNNLQLLLMNFSND